MLFIIFPAGLPLSCSSKKLLKLVNYFVIIRKLLSNGILNRKISVYK